MTNLIVQQANGQSQGRVPKRCGAKAKSTGQPCQRWGMENGRCMMHGGKAGRPIKHGRYATVYKRRLAEKLATIAAQPVDDITEEVNIMRALMDDYMQRYDDPHLVLTGKDVIGKFELFESIGRMVERLVKIRNSNALTGQEIQLLVKAVAATMEKYVPGDKLPQALGELRGLIGAS